jgi:hypothetical protein
MNGCYKPFNFQPAFAVSALDLLLAGDDTGSYGFESNPMVMTVKVRSFTGSFSKENSGVCTPITIRPASLYFAAQLFT